MGHTVSPKANLRKPRSSLVRIAARRFSSPKLRASCRFYTETLELKEASRANPTYAMIWEVLRSIIHAPIRGLRKCRGYLDPPGASGRGYYRVFVTSRLRPRTCLDLPPMTADICSHKVRRSYSRPRCSLGRAHVHAEGPERVSD